MNIMHELYKKIKTLIMTTGEYPKEMEISREDFEKLKIEVRQVCTLNPSPNQDCDNAKFCGVKLKVIN